MAYRGLAPDQRAQIWIGGPQPELLFETDDVLIEASNWSLDGTSLILNGPWFTLASRPPDTEERATPVGRSAVGAGDLGGAGPARSAFAAGPAVGPGRGRCRAPNVSHSRGVSRQPPGRQNTRAVRPRSARRRCSIHAVLGPPN